MKPIPSIGNQHVPNINMAMNRVWNPFLEPIFHVTQTLHHFNRLNPYFSYFIPVKPLLVLNVGNGWVAGGCWDHH